MERYAMAADYFEKLEEIDHDLQVLGTLSGWCSVMQDNDKRIVSDAKTAASNLGAAYSYTAVEDIQNKIAAINSKDAGAIQDIIDIIGSEQTILMDDYNEIVAEQAQAEAAAAAAAQAAAANTNS
jgi:hypothetical protein